MATNGPCHCLEGMRPAERLRVRAALHAYRAEVKRLRAVVDLVKKQPDQHDDSCGIFGVFAAPPRCTCGREEMRKALRHAE